jgi:hypothetical protein
LRGRAIVRGGAGIAARTIGLSGGILTYAVELGIIEQNPVPGVRKPKDQVNAHRLSEQAYHTLGEILRKVIACMGRPRRRRSARPSPLDAFAW